jgi:hypothetical protein
MMLMRSPIRVMGNVVVQKNVPRAAPGNQEELDGVRRQGQLQEVFDDIPSYGPDPALRAGF